MTAWSSRPNSAAAFGSPVRTSAGSVRYWPLTLLTVGALTLLRYVTLHATPLNLLPDEAQYWAWAQTLDLGYFSKPPMIAWLIAATTAVCGDGEGCVRAASPALHAATALLVFALARDLGDERVGFWAGVGYATLPGVSFSTLLISTDVPLLFFWAAALLAFVRWLRTGSAVWAVGLGVAIGLGLLSKYAMAYFALCAALFLAVTPAARRSVSGAHLLLAATIAAALFAPNVIWNVYNGWSTVEHTAANANWSGQLFNAGEALEFLAAQFGVFGPILMAAFVLALFKGRPWATPERRLLLCFSLPVVLTVTLQAFISRAHANWAAPAYIAGVVLVTMWLLSAKGGRVAAVASFGFHLLFTLALSGYAAGVLAFEPPRLAEPIFARQRGWDVLGRELTRELEERPGWTLMADERKLMAELVYYTRSHKPTLAMWDYDRPARNFFEATARVGSATGERVLLVTADKDPKEIIARFGQSQRLQTLSIPVGPTRVKVWHLFELQGLRPA